MIAAAARLAVVATIASAAGAQPAIQPGEWEVRAKGRTLAAVELLPKGVAEDATARVAVRRHCLGPADVARRPARVFLAGNPGCRLVSDTSTGDRFEAVIACPDGRAGRMTGRVGPASYVAVGEMTHPRGMTAITDVSARRLGDCAPPPIPPPAAAAAPPPPTVRPR